MKYFYYRDNWTLKKVRMEDVLFFDTNGNYLTIVLGEGERYNTSRCSLEEAMKQLPSDLFVRINARQAVALSKIEKIGRTSLFLEGRGEYELTISPKYNRHLKSKILILGKDRSIAKK